MKLCDDDWRKFSPERADIQNYSHTQLKYEIIFTEFIDTGDVHIGCDWMDRVLGYLCAHKR